MANRELLKDAVDGKTYTLPAIQVNWKKHLNEESLRTAWEVDEIMDEGLICTLDTMVSFSREKWQTSAHLLSLFRIIQSREVFCDTYLGDDESPPNSAWNLRADKPVNG